VCHLTAAGQGRAEQRRRRVPPPQPPLVLDGPPISGTAAAPPPPPRNDLIRARQQRTAGGRALARRARARNPSSARPAAHSTAAGVWSSLACCREVLSGAGPDVAAGADPNVPARRPALLRDEHSSGGDSTLLRAGPLVSAWKCAAHPRCADRLPVRQAATRSAVVARQAAGGRTPQCAARHWSAAQPTP